MSARSSGGSRYLYAPFDAASARIDANERVLEERWQGLNVRLTGIEAALERLERRLWVAVFGMVSVVLAQGLSDILQLNILR
jgi:hypothetical protein